jgi:hypothetical protein
VSLGSVLIFSVTRTGSRNAAVNDARMKKIYTFQAPPTQALPTLAPRLGLRRPSRIRQASFFRLKNDSGQCSRSPDGKAVVEDYERVSRVVRTLEVDLDNPGSEARVVFRRNERDAYHDPGTPVLKTTPDGRQQIIETGGAIYLSGLGASPSGDKPFLDRFNLAAGKAERLFQSNSGFEELIAMLDDTGTRLLTRRQSPTDPPNYFIRTGDASKRLTEFPNPTPQTAGIKKQLVRYQRADGVPLSFTLYLPPDYKPGTRLPTLVWAYPFEFSDADTAGQVTGHAEQSFPRLQYYQMPMLHGYALLIRQGCRSSAMRILLTTPMWISSQWTLKPQWTKPSRWVWQTATAWAWLDTAMARLWPPI